jgi:hypothetical protein
VISLNVHELSLFVAKKEGKKREQNIAQLKEGIKYTLIGLGRKTNKDIIQTINRYRPKAKRVPYGK